MAAQDLNKGALSRASEALGNALLSRSLLLLMVSFYIVFIHFIRYYDQKGALSSHLIC